MLLGVHDLGHTHSLASLQQSGLSDQQTLLLTESCLYSVRQEAPTNSREAVSVPICAKQERNGPASADQGFSTANQDSQPTMCCHLEGDTHPHSSPPSHLFCQHKTYLQNGLRQLITWFQIRMSTLVINGQRVDRTNGPIKELFNTIHEASANK